MRFTEIIDSAFSLYRRHFQLFFWLCTLMFCCDILSMIAFKFLVEGWIVEQIVYIIGSLLTALMFGPMVILASEIYLGHQTTLRQVIQRFLKRVDVYFGCSIIYIVLPVILSLFTESISKFSNGLAAIRFVVSLSGPLITIYLLISWIFYGPVLMIENTTVKGAFSRSRYIVQGKWWSVFWVVIKLLFLMVAILLIFTISFYLLLIMLGLFQIETSFRDVIEQQIRLLIDSDHMPTSLTDWVITVFTTAIGAWMAPIYIISITILYYNRRSQNEGIDKEGDTKL